jgi:hypothetical protein
VLSVPVNAEVAVYTSTNVFVAANVLLAPVSVEITAFTSGK